MLHPRLTVSLALALAAAACSDDDPGEATRDAAAPADLAMPEVDGGTDERDAFVALDAGLEVDAGELDGGSLEEADAGEPAGDASMGRLGAGAWIRQELAAVPALTGTFTRRTTVEAPALVHDATGCCSKYAFYVRDDEAPNDRRVGFVNVSIADLVSTDAYGAGIGTSRDFPGTILYLADVTIEPRWPDWAGYAATNYDGMVLDGSAAIYAENLTIREYNADTAIDIKAQEAQLVDLTIEGPGHRTLRYWRTGPHYLVGSTLNNTGELGSGAMLWFSNCDETVLRVYDTTFDGETTVANPRVQCDRGSRPTIEYLEVDPRTTGEMHPMFSY